MADALINNSAEYLVSDNKISPDTSERDASNDTSDCLEKDLIPVLNHKINSSGINYRGYISDSSDINSESSSIFNNEEYHHSTGDLTLISKSVSIDAHSTSATSRSSIIVPAERNPVSDLLRSPSSFDSTDDRPVSRSRRKSHHAYQPSRHSIPDMSTTEYYSQQRASMEELSRSIQRKLVITTEPKKNSLASSSSSLHMISREQKIIPEDEDDSREEREPKKPPAPSFIHQPPALTLPSASAIMKKTKHDILNISQSRFITMEEALSAEEEEEEEMFNKQLDAIEDQDKNEIKSLEQRRSIKRINAIKELMDTEETYSRDLGILCTHFFAIIQESSCISAEEIDVLVRNAMDIFSFQEKFMEALVDAHGTEEEKKNGICYKGNLKNIAACFVAWAPKFDIYLDYCVRQDHAASVYNELLQNNIEFSNLIERLHTFHRVSFGFSRLKFDDYMIIPFQRIFRYRLLLQTVTKATQKDSEEYELLSEAQNLIHAIASKINDEKSKMEAKRKTALFLSRLDSDWCLPKRWFSTLGVCSLIGTLEVRSNLDNKPKRIGCALFDHYMIMAKAKKHNQYEPRYWFPLRKFDIENLPNVEGTISYTWLLHSEDNTLELSAMCELEKNVWVEALTNAIRKSKRLYSKSVDSNEYLLEQLFVSSFDQHAQSRNTTSKHVDVCTALDPSVPIEYPMPSGSTSLSQSAIFNRQPNRSNHRASHPIFSSNQELPALELMPHPIDHGARSPGLRSQSSIGDLREFFSNSVSEKWSQRKFNQYHTRCKSVDTKFDDVCTTPILTARANSMHRHGSASHYQYASKKRKMASQNPVATTPIATPVNTHSALSLFKHHHAVVSTPTELLSPVFYSPSTSLSESCHSACSSRRPSIGGMNTESMIFRLAQRHSSVHRSSSMKSAVGLPSAELLPNPLSSTTSIPSSSSTMVTAAGLLSGPNNTSGSRSTHFFGRMVEKLGQIGTPGKLRRSQMIPITTLANSSSSLRVGNEERLPSTRSKKKFFPQFLHTRHIKK